MDLNELFTKSISGDGVATEKLFASLSERFYQIIHYRLRDEQQAKDVVQEAIYAIACDYKGLSGEANFAAWAYKVLQNRLLAHLKKSQAKNRLDEKFRDRAAARDLTPNPRLVGRLLECLKKVHEKNNRHARVLNLCYQGFTTTEICQRVKVTRNGLYVILHRARIMLEECLEGGVVAHE